MIIDMYLITSMNYNSICLIFRLFPYLSFFFSPFANVFIFFLFNFMQVSSLNVNLHEEFNIKKDNKECSEHNLNHKLLTISW